MSDTDSKPIQAHYDEKTSSHTPPGETNEIQRLPSLNGSIQDPEVKPKISWRVWWMVFLAGWQFGSMSLTLTPAGLWTTQIATNLGGANVSIWLAHAFQVVNAVLGPPMSMIGDQVGRKWIIIGAAFIGSIGTFVFASAKSMNVAILGATIFGVYFAAQGNTSAVASEIVSRRHRGTGQLLYMVTSVFGAAVGALVSGAFLANGNPVGWRCGFYFAGGMQALNCFWMYISYHPAPVPNPSNKTIVQRCLNFDILGTILLGCGIVPLQLALNWGGRLYTWHSSAVLASLIIGIGFLVILGLHQYFFKKDGLFARPLWRSRNFLICLIGLFVEGMIYISFNVYAGIITSTLYETRLMIVTLRFLVFSICQFVGGFFWAYVVYRWRIVKEALIAGFVLFLAGTIGLCFCGPQNSAGFLGCVSVMGFGFSSPIALIQTVIQFAVAPEYMALATAQAIMCRSVGGAVGTAIATAIYVAKLAIFLPQGLTQVAVTNGISSASIPGFIAAISAKNSTAALAISGVTPTIFAEGLAARAEAYSNSFHYIWYTNLPFVCVALISMIALKDVKKQMNALIDRPLEAIHHSEHVDPETAKQHLQHAVLTT